MDLQSPLSAPHCVLRCTEALYLLAYLFARVLHKIMEFGWPPRPRKAPWAEPAPDYHVCVCCAEGEGGVHERVRVQGGLEVAWR